MGYASDANRLAIETAHPYFRVADVLLSEGFSVAAITELFDLRDKQVIQSLATGAVPAGAEAAAPAVEQAVYGLIKGGKLPAQSGGTRGRMDRDRFILQVQAVLCQ